MSNQTTDQPRDKAGCRVVKQATKNQDFFWIFYRRKKGLFTNPASNKHNSKACLILHLILPLITCYGLITHHNSPNCNLTLTYLQEVFVSINLPKNSCPPLFINPARETQMILLPDKKTAIESPMPNIIHRHTIIDRG